jgi:hypothetical protein
MSRRVSPPKKPSRPVKRTAKRKARIAPGSSGNAYLDSLCDFLSIEDPVEVKRPRRGTYYVSNREHP